MSINDDNMSTNIDVSKNHASNTSIYRGVNDNNDTILTVNSNSVPGRLSPTSSTDYAPSTTITSVSMNSRNITSANSRSPQKRSLSSCALQQQQQPHQQQQQQQNQTFLNSRKQSPIVDYDGSKTIRSNNQQYSVWLMQKKVRESFGAVFVAYRTEGFASILCEVVVRLLHAFILMAVFVLTLLWRYKFRIFLCCSMASFGYGWWYILYAQEGPHYFGLDRSIRGGEFGDRLNSWGRQRLYESTMKELQERQERIRIKRRRIEDGLERDVTKFVTSPNRHMDIPQHVFWALHLHEMEEHQEELLNSWTEYIDESSTSKLNSFHVRQNALNVGSPKKLKILPKSPGLENVVHRVIPYGRDEMRRTMRRHDMCQPLHQIFVSLPSWREKVALWSVCEMFWYGGVFVGEDVEKIIVPLHDMMNLKNFGGLSSMKKHKGWVILKELKDTKTFTIDMTMFAFSPRHPILLHVIQQMYKQNIRDRLFDRSYNAVNTIADLIYKSIVNDVDEKELSHVLRKGGGLVSGTSNSQWFLLTERCELCEEVECCQVKDDTRVVTNMLRMEKEYNPSLEIVDLNYNVVVKEQSQPKKEVEIFEKKAMIDILIEEGCNPSWLCSRCLDYGGRGNINECRTICGDCYKHIMCLPESTSKTETKIDINVHISNKSNSSSIQPRLIPRIIHQTWFEDLTPDRYPDLVRLQNSWVATGWDYRFYNDEDARLFVVKNYPKRFSDAYDSILPGAFKADFFRYLVLLVHGGIYADIDVLLDSTLDSFVTPELSFFAPIDAVGEELDEKFCLWNGFMGASPGHPFLVRTVERSLNLIEHRADILDIEHEMCLINGPDFENWKTRFLPSLMLTGPCALGASVNEALERDSLTKFDVGLVKASSNGYNLGSGNDKENILFHVLGVS